MKNPLNPFEAASIAGNSRRRVWSDVQYCIVGGGGGGGCSAGVVWDWGRSVGRGEGGPREGQVEERVGGCGVLQGGAGEGGRVSA